MSIPEGAPTASATAATSRIEDSAMRPRAVSFMISSIRARNGRERVERGIADQLGPDLGTNVIRDGDIKTALPADRGDPLGPLAGPARGFAENELLPLVCRTTPRATRVTPM